MQTGADLTDAGGMGELKFYEKVKSNTPVKLEYKIVNP